MYSNTVKHYYCTSYHIVSLLIMVWTVIKIISSVFKCSDGFWWNVNWFIQSDCNCEQQLCREKTDSAKTIHPGSLPVRETGPNVPGFTWKQGSFTTEHDHTVYTSVHWRYLQPLHTFKPPLDSITTLSAAAWQRNRSRIVSLRAAYSTTRSPQQPGRSTRSPVQDAHLAWKNVWEMKKEVFHLW